MAFILKTVLNELRTDAGFSIAILGMAASKVSFICNGQFFTIFVTEVYELQGLDKQAARDHLSWLALISNVLSVPTISIFGVLSDHFKVWKMIGVVNLGILGFMTLMQYDILKNDQ